MRFLLVEDNQDLASATVDRLTMDGHVVDHASTLRAAEDFKATTDYDLIFLDIMLPDGDGRSFLSTHRLADDPTPVIVTTARSEVSDRVGILDLGADDYVTKPFDFSELEARCRAVLRRRGGAARNVKMLGDIEFDPLSGTLRLGEKQIKLRNRELRLFEVFANAPDQIFPKSKLLDRLFSYGDEVSENAIEVYVGRLRRHLQGSSVEIQTVRGVGYMLSVR
ncbi:response regulator transcription factor [uncultured Hoeflea sp.]|uniref:response regulator transcription factor n=1 Tax=uncultured Hoeflea sp. TaxID=538666 RepID=UPI002637E5B3|nr:response regulator transcription factor [uncultured Hoeflea sp.]